MFKFLKHFSKNKIRWRSIHVLSHLRSSSGWQLWQTRKISTMRIRTAYIHVPSHASLELYLFWRKTLRWDIFLNTSRTRWSTGDNRDRKALYQGRRLWWENKMTTLKLIENIIQKCFLYIMCYSQRDFIVQKVFHLSLMKY